MSIRNLSQSNIASKTLKNTLGQLWLVTGGQIGGGGPYVWSFSYTSGYGTRYSPSSLPGGDGATFYPYAAAVAVGTNGSPYVTAWPFTTSGSIGFGTAYANPSSLPPAWARDVRFSPSGQSLVAGGGPAVGTGSLYAYTFTTSGGLGTRFAYPATIPTDLVSSVKFNPTGTTVFLDDDQTPFGYAYPWSDSTGFGTKYANPSSLPSGTSGHAITVNNAGNAVVFLSGSSTYLNAYSWSDASGWGTRYSNPSPLPSPGWDEGIAFCPTDDAIAGSCNSSSNALQAYAWSNSSGFGTKYTNPTGLPGFIYYVTFSPDGTLLSFGNSSSPGIYTLKWASATGFGSVYASPSSTQTSSVCVDFMYS